MKSLQLKKILKNRLENKNFRKFNLLFGSDAELKLHLGCGTVYKKGWINIDNNSDKNIKEIDVDWDLSRGIPFPELKISYIYNEHFIEHLSYEDGLQFLKECNRVLKKNGVLRIACPNLDDVINGYIKDNWRSMPWVDKYNYNWIPSRCYMINICMNQYPWGHKYLYNKEDLIQRLCDAGFKKENINETSYSKSDYPCFVNIESRVDSMIFEIKK